MDMNQLIELQQSATFLGSIGGLLSAIAQGRVAAGAINILAKKPEHWSKGLLLCGIVECYAILSLLASMLMLLWI